MVHITRDLLTVLLEHAESTAPEEANVLLSTTEAADLTGDLEDIDPETPVLTHFTLPDVGGSVAAVFGMDLGTPAERGRARFISHPDGESRVTEEDDLAGVILVAIPPWDETSTAAFDRAGRSLPLTAIDAEPPEESIPE